MSPFEWIFQLKHEFSIFARFPIVIPTVINGAGSDWWAKEKKCFFFMAFSYLVYQITTMDWVLAWFLIFGFLAWSNGACKHQPTKCLNRNQSWNAYVPLLDPGFISFQEEYNVVPWIGEQPYTEMLFRQFSNIIIYVKIVGKIPDQLLSVWLFSNPGDKVLHSPQTVTK